MLRTLLLLCLALPAAAQDAPTTAAPDAASGPRRIVSLYSDLRAMSTGDLLTVVLEERTSARRTTTSSDQTETAYGGSASVSPTLGGTFSLGGDFARRSGEDSRTVQSDLLVGTLTARVVGVDPAGNLLVEGERQLDVDGTTHILQVSGLVRPQDVGPSNSVLSHQIADARVAYRTEGGGGLPFLSSKLLTTIGAAAVLIGAVVLGSSLSGSAGDALPTGE